MALKCVCWQGGIKKGKIEGFHFMAVDFLKISNTLRKRKSLCPGSLGRVLGAV